MFYNAKSFNQPLNKWDVSSVIYMEYMFINALSFNQDINNWNVSNVKYMSYMLSGSLLEKNNNLPEWYSK